MQNQRKKFLHKKKRAKALSSKQKPAIIVFALFITSDMGAKNIPAAGGNLPVTSLDVKPVNSAHLRLNAKIPAVFSGIIKHKMVKLLGYGVAILTYPGGIAV